MYLADSHAHLNFDAFKEDLPSVLQRARQQGVRYLNMIGTRLDDVEELLAMSQLQPHLYTTVGVHPHYADEYVTATPEQIAQLADHEKVVAIGETGLDYHYDKADREHQKQVFRTQIRAAHMAKRPLVIHTRQAEADTRAIMEEEQAAACGGVIHCFTGTQEMADWALEQGFYIALSGIVTFNSAQDLQEIARHIPAERLLVETDAPYLAPLPHRGVRNEPAFVAQTLKTIAKFRGDNAKDLADITTENYRRLFRVDQARTHEKGVLAYPIGNRLYMNVTHGCTLKCQFCPKWQAPEVHAFNLALTGNPSSAELIAAFGELDAFDEIVFCGYGEPTLRLQVMLEVAAAAKQRGKRVRLNTDGLANFVYGEDIAPKMAGLVDAISISLNAQNAELYDRHCVPGKTGAYAGLLSFVDAVKPYVPEVTLTAISGLEGVDIPACAAIARQKGVKFRARQLDRVG
ncbi:hydrolase, TatD family [Magnetococcus marinus MC-1]|uniref:Hydrolase, TatD family n=1 Tax=Magnetococcus marinus (strain ATCC BAA-1437 / JCM 17883 / MC-1) TaxID=156889 RepID=A0L8T2_MAGMM|nr:TatD family hydrolase [Magnetococcus marinus]ABK44375.1 hydrolase, TatD family [Magnetococcus marinus MC-1]